MYLARSYSNINKIKTQRKAVILGFVFSEFCNSILEGETASSNKALGVG